MDPVTLDAKTTALILIDLQHAVVGRITAPHAAADVVKKSRALAETFRKHGGTVVYVRVDLGSFLKPIADEPSRLPDNIPTEMSQLVPEAGFESGDILITKRFWGAFGGTDLEQQLKQRGIKTVVMGGIATNIGVESTARTAAELGFNVVLIEDAMASMDAESHRFAVEKIFPRLGRVRQAEQVKLS